MLTPKHLHVFELNNTVMMTKKEALKELRRLKRLPFHHITGNDIAGYHVNVVRVNKGWIYLFDRVNEHGKWVTSPVYVPE